MAFCFNFIRGHQNFYLIQHQQTNFQDKRKDKKKKLSAFQNIKLINVYYCELIELFTITLE